MDKLPNGWKLTKIGSVIHKGRTINPKLSPNKEFTYIDISSIDNNQYKIKEPKIITGKDAPSRARKEVQIDDIVFATTRPNLKNIAIVTQNYEYPVASTGFCVLSPKKDLIESKYLFRLLLTNNLQEQIQPFIRGAQYPAISDSNIHSCLLPLPPIPEQKRIVSKIDALFERIDKSIALLEENITHTESLMASALDEVFLELESKYELQPLENVIRVINGRAYKKQEMLNSGKYKLLRVGNFFTSQAWYYSDLELEPDKYCDNGDLLYAWSASFGPKIWDGDKTIFHYHIWKMEPINNLIEKEFAYYLLQRDTIKIKEEGGRGVGMVHITKGGIEKRKIVVPPNKEQLKAVKMIKSLFDNLTKLQTEQQDKLTNLKALKESILDKAFKGEI